MKKSEWSEAYRELRMVFPHPAAIAEEDGSSKKSNPNNHEYCVGGALCIAAGTSMRFPSRNELQRVIKRLGGDPQYAQSVIVQNDLGHFGKAWSYLERAMEGIL